MDTNELKAALGRISSVLRELGCSYHFTGGLASICYGEPRFTQDIDLVVKLAPGGEELSQLLEKCAIDFLFDEVAIREIVAQKGIFQMLDQETMIKVDFHVGEAIPGELARAVEVELFPSLSVPLVSKEDAILSKLIWIKKGSGKSEQDVVAMLKYQDELDKDYLEEKASELGLLSVLRKFAPK